MDEVKIQPADVLTRLFANNPFRAFLALAIVLRMADIYYSAGESFLKGYQDGSPCAPAVSNSFNSRLPSPTHPKYLTPHPKIEHK
jgi:hypothetical protein